MLLLRRENKKKLFLSVFLLVTLVLVLLPVQTVKAQNASLYFSPSLGRVVVGETFSLAVRMNTGGVAVNAAEGSIVFDAQKLAATSISKSGSVFTIWASELEFSNAEGTINFAGGIPNPGYSGSNGLVLTINFKAKSTTTVRGQTEVVFVSGAVLANDGEGSNILASLGKANYFIGASTAVPSTPASVTPVPAPVSTPVPVSVSEDRTIAIRSSTHPDQTKWYAHKNPIFSWDVPSGVTGVRLVLSKKPETAPIIDYAPAIAEKTLTDLEDGVWYLNGQFRTSAGFGPVTSFRFQIDTQKPADFVVTRVDGDDFTNPQPELLFGSSDELSGLDRYELKIDRSDWLPVSLDFAGKPYKLPRQLPGMHEVGVKAVDRAGNFASSSLKVIINAIPVPEPIIKEEIISPKIKTDETAVIKGTIAREIVVKGAVIKIVTVKIEVFKFENDSSSGSIAGSAMEVKKTLVKTIEVPVDANGNFEAKIGNLEAGAYTTLIYGKDERGAISNAFAGPVLVVEGDSVLVRFAKRVYHVGWRAFDRSVDFLSQGWWLIAAGILVVAMVVLAAKKMVPFMAAEISKIRFIASEYQSLKKLRKIDSKTKLELGMLQKDIRKELKLLKIISSHRPLYSEERYLKNKLERYYALIEGMKEKKIK